MTTPEQPDDQPAWGRPPAGGWGAADPGSETRAWGSSPQADDGPTRVDQPRPGPPPPPPPGYGQQGYPPPGEAPGWTRQPPPGGGWNAAPAPWAPPPGQPFPPGQPGAWGPPGGYPPLPRPSEGRAPQRSRLPFVVAGVVVLLLAVGAVLAFVAPGFLRTTVFDQAALQDGVQRVLVEDYRYAEVSGVACGTPGQQIRVRAGDEFTCTATVDGEPATVSVRVVADDGTYEVGRPE